LTISSASTRKKDERTRGGKEGGASGNPFSLTGGEGDSTIKNRGRGSIDYFRKRGEKRKDDLLIIPVQCVGRKR